MNKFILRWIINALALFAAISLISGLRLENDAWYAYVWLGLIFGIANAFIRPLLKFLTCPLIILTLGLFTLILNTIMFYITGWLGSFFGYGIYINSFGSAFLGALLISLVSLALSLFVRDELNDKKHAH